MRKSRSLILLTLLPLLVACDDTDTGASAPTPETTVTSEPNLEDLDIVQPVANVRDPQEFVDTEAPGYSPDAPIYQFELPTGQQCSVMMKGQEYPSLFSCDVDLGEGYYGFTPMSPGVARADKVTYFEDAGFAPSVNYTGMALPIEPVGVINANETVTFGEFTVATDDVGSETRVIHEGGRTMSIGDSGFSSDTWSQTPTNEDSSPVGTICHTLDDGTYLVALGAGTPCGEAIEVWAEYEAEIAANAATMGQAQIYDRGDWFCSIFLDIHSDPEDRVQARSCTKGSGNDSGQKIGVVKYDPAVYD